MRTRITAAATSLLLAIPALAQDAGHDGKFFLAGADAAFRLNVAGQSQTRYNLNFRDTDDDADEDFTNGFHLRRTKLDFNGSIIEKNLTYRFVGAFSRSGGSFSLEDAWGDYKLDNGVAFRWGQFKLPLLREESISSKQQLAADRSVVNETFNQDYSQAVEARYDSDAWRLKGAISDGLGSRNTAYTDPAEADVALTARAELRLGDAAWKLHDDYTSFQGQDTGALLGGAIHWQTSGSTANADTFSGAASPEIDAITYTCDASYEGSGWSLACAFVWRWTDSSAAADEWDDLGLLAQGALFVSDDTELFARWDAILPDDDRASSDEFHTLTAGFNHYFVPESHAAKFTADIQYFFNDLAGSSSIVKANEGIGLLGSSDDGELAIRLQMQLLF